PIQPGGNGCVESSCTLGCILPGQMFESPKPIVRSRLKPTQNERNNCLSHAHDRLVILMHKPPGRGGVDGGLSGPTLGALVEFCLERACIPRRDFDLCVSSRCNSFASSQFGDEKLPNWRGFKQPAGLGLFYDCVGQIQLNGHAHASKMT